MDKPEFQVIKPPNTLAVKASKVTGSSIADKLDQAEAKIAEFGKDFPKWGLDEIEKIESALAAVRQLPENQDELIGNIYGQAMDLTSQAGGFGFTLITEIGNSLKNFTESRQDASAREIDIIAAHVDALRVVLVQNIRGDGGKVGRQIVSGLLQLTQK